MYIDLITFAGSFLLAGLIIGLLSGLFLIGGLVRIPIFIFLFLYFGVDPSIVMQLSIGTSLVLSIPTSTISFLNSMKQYRDNQNSDIINVRRFLKAWLPALLLGIFLALILIRHLSGLFLAGIFLFTALLIALQVLIFRDNIKLSHRFSGWIMQSIILSISGFISILTGITGILIDSVLKAFGYNYESTYAAQVSGLIISVIGTIGYVINGFGVSGEPAFSLGYVNLTAALMIAPGLVLAYPIGVKFRDSDKVRNFRENIVNNNLIDQLTGLNNRTYFEVTYSYMLTSAEWFSEQASLMIIDPDDLGLYNAQYGQKAGNRLLCALSILLKDSLRSVDILVRYSGDAFAVLLPRTDKDASITIAERINEKFKEISIQPDYGGTPVSLSIGISTYPSCTEDKDSLLWMAEQALIVSKLIGKDRILHYEDIPINRVHG